MVEKNERTVVASYPDEKSKSEDAVYLTQLWRSNATVKVFRNDPKNYFRLFHGRNTWDIGHFKFSRIPGNNTWCVGKHLRIGCSSDEVNELHRKVLDLYTPLL